MLQLRCLWTWLVLALRNRTLPTDRLFMEAVYEVYLQRPADNEGLDYYLPFLSEKPAGYRRVMQSVAASRECASVGTEPPAPVPIATRAEAKNPDCRTAALEFIATHYKNQSRYANDDEYVRAHARRFATTLALSAEYMSPDSRVLDVGSSYHMPILMWQLLGIRHLHACGFAEEFVGFSDGLITETDDPLLEMRLRIDPCHIESERWPYESGSFDVLTCSEVIEHLREHPLFMMAEANRVLVEGGQLIITTPNSSSYRAILEILQQSNPYLFSRYNADRVGMEHVKEYSVGELQLLYRVSGFEIVAHTTFSPYADDPTEADPEFLEFLRRYGLVMEMSGSTHFIVGRKVGKPECEYCEPIYTTTKRWDAKPSHAGGTASTAS